MKVENFVKITRSRSGSLSAINTVVFSIPPIGLHNIGGNGKTEWNKRSQNTMNIYTNFMNTATVKPGRLL